MLLRAESTYVRTCVLRKVIKRARNASRSSGHPTSTFARHVLNAERAKLARNINGRPPTSHRGRHPRVPPPPLSLCSVVVAGAADDGGVAQGAALEAELPLGRGQVRGLRRRARRRGPAGRRAAREQVLRRRAGARGGRGGRLLLHHRQGDSARHPHGVGRRRRRLGQRLQDGAAQRVQVSLIFRALMADGLATSVCICMRHMCPCTSALALLS